MARSGLTSRKKAAGPQWTLTAVGDAIIGHRTRHLDRPEDPGFHDLCRLIRAVDVASVNLETNVFDMATFTGSPGRSAAAAT